MAFSDFWRRGREGANRDRNRDRDRWRTVGNERNPQRDYGASGSASDRDYELQDEDFERRGWRQGSDYYGDNPERYGPERYGVSERDRMTSFNDRWQDSYRGEGSPSYGRSSAYGGEDYGSRYGERSYGGPSWGSPSWEDIDRGSSLLYGEPRGRFGGGAGQFRGLGPRGYRRSDERVREDACECLTEDDRIDASNIDVTVKDCEITLSGAVNSREEKRRAEDLIEGLPGVKDVHNKLRVVNEGGQVEGAQGHLGTIR